MTDPKEPSAATSGAIARLSSPTVRKQPRRALTEVELTDLRRIATALIPAVGDAPAGGDIADFEAQATEGLAILDASFDPIARVLATLRDCPTADLFDTLRRLDSDEPELFYPLSLLITAMYVYSAEVEARHGYPHPHRNPPPPMQAADEIESGILAPVMDRGSCYVPAP